MPEPLPAPSRNRIQQWTGQPVRADNVGGLLDAFIFLAVITILVVRILLWFTGYPQIGGGTLHIAHMLWGGLLMTAALILMQSVILRWARRIGAVLGGIGFGLFIDELGKFVTKDNDYFFRPTFALIYILFIIIYFSTRYLLRTSPFSPREALVNAIDLLKDAAVGEMNANDKARAERHLASVPDNDPLKAPLVTIYNEVEAWAADEPAFWRRWGQSLARLYQNLVASRYFPKILAAFFLALAVFKLWDLEQTSRRIINWESFNLIDAAMLISTLLTFLFVIIGDWFLLRGARKAAYLWLDRGLIVAILIGQVFVFVNVQLRGILWLAVLLFFYAGLRLLMVQEERLGSSEKAV